jgi:hypothetical protein
MATVLDLIWGKWEQKYFSENQKKDSTGKSERRPSGKSPAGAKRKGGAAAGQRAMARIEPKA